jgi:O-antigen/teichoic acid export membrane protein
LENQVTTIETASVPDDTAGGPPVSMHSAKQKRWRASAIAGDIATLGTGTFLSALFNVALVFVVPKLISVQDYGYWRMFALYAGYTGFLHFGFADGALLRWAGHPLEAFHREVRPALKYLFWQQVILLAPAVAIATIALHGPLRFVVVAIAIFASVYNLGALLLFGLQAARSFVPVAISAVAAPTLFLGFVLLWQIEWQGNYREIILFDLAGWFVVLVFLLAWIRPWESSAVTVPLKALAQDCLANGWPMLLTNMGMTLTMYADRLAASWAATIQDFAQYSLAASAMAVPLTAIQACNSVLFPHLAGVTQERRRRIYGITSRTVVMAWAILLPYYFALEFFIHHFLRKYAPSLAYARILLLGIPFLAAIQILQSSYAFLSGIQKQFMIWTGIALVFSLGISAFAAFFTGSLRIVAGAQVAVLGAWWLFNEWALQKLTGDNLGDWLKFLAIYGAASCGYWLATSWNVYGFGVSIVVYYLGVAAVLTAFCRRELRVLGSLAMGKI